MKNFYFIESRCGENGDFPTEITSPDIGHLSEMMLKNNPMQCIEGEDGSVPCIEEEDGPVACIEEEDGSIPKPRKIFMKCCDEMVADFNSLDKFLHPNPSLSPAPSSQIGSVLGVAIFFSKIRSIDTKLSRDGKKVYLTPCCLTTDTTITKDTTILKTVYLRSTLSF